MGEAPRLPTLRIVASVHASPGAARYCAMSYCERPAAVAVAVAAAASPPPAAAMESLCVRSTLIFSALLTTGFPRRLPRDASPTAGRSRLQSRMKVSRSGTLRLSRAVRDQLRMSSCETEVMGMM